MTFNPTCKATNKPPLLALLAAFVAISVQAPPQAAVELVTTKQAIPKNFKTYSLFLVCNPQWLDPATNAGFLTPNSRGNS